MHIDTRIFFPGVSHQGYRVRPPRDGTGPTYLDMQQARLADARAHADLVVDTSGVVEEEVRSRVLEYLVENH